MKQRRIGHGILAIVLAFVLVVGLLPIAAVAEGENGTIASFAAPQTEIEVEAGTAKADIGLPETLAVTMQGEESADIPVTWDDGGLYDKDVAGAYTFSAVIPASYTYAGARPVAVVTVKGEEPKEGAIEQIQGAIDHLLSLEDVEKMDKNSDEFDTVVSVMDAIDELIMNATATMDDDEYAAFEEAIGEEQMKKYYLIYDYLDSLADPMTPFSLNAPPTITVDTTGKPVVLINEATSVQTAYASVAAAAAAIGSTSGDYTIVLINNSSIYSADLYSTAKNANITITGSYNNSSGILQSTKTVTFSGTRLAPNTTKTVTFKDVIVSGGPIYACSRALVMDTGVTMSSASGIIVYGGSYSNESSAQTNITLKSGTYNYVYGGSNYGNISGGSSVYIGSDATVINSVYGGGSTSTVSGGSTVTVDGATVKTVYGGGGSYLSSGALNVTVKNGATINEVFGGNQGNGNGTYTGATTVTVDGSTITGAVYGGADALTHSGSATIDIRNNSTVANVYGGNKQNASAYGNLISGTRTINISDSHVTGNVSGTSMRANANNPNAAIVYNLGMERIITAMLFLRGAIRRSLP